jgi:hypothetical protein
MKLKTKVGAAGKKMKGLKGPLFWGNLGDRCGNIEQVAAGQRNTP